MTRSPPPSLLPPALGLLLSVSVLLACDPLPEHALAWLGAYAGAFSCYLWALGRVWRGARCGRWLIPAVALAARLILLPAAPGDDVHRYLWEGRVLLAGQNPWRLAPDHPALAALAADDPDHAFVNHPDWPAIYPPGVQLLHSLVAASGSGVWGLKLLLLACELLLLWMLTRWLAQRGLPRERLLVYAWNPLPLVTVAAMAHHDVLAATALVAALMALERGARRATPVLLCGAMLLKGFALAALPALTSVHARRGSRAGWLWGAALVATATLPVFLLGGGLSHSLLRFGRELHFNGSLHALFSLVLPSPASTGVCVLLWLGIAAWVQLRSEPDVARSALLLLAAALLLLPTLHPWYLLALLPLLVIHPWWGWILFSGSIALPWLAYVEMGSTGPWLEWPMLRLPEYAPLFLWLAWIALRKRRLTARKPT